jgi:preprotein translocase subunit SecE
MSSDSDPPDVPKEEAQAEASDEETSASEGNESALVLAESAEITASASESDEASANADAPEAGHIGVRRYVHAAFFAAGILTAYLSGKVLLSAWNTLADWPAAVRSMPMLIEYGDEDRASYTLVIGAVVGVLLVLRYYRRPAVRSWATDVASELAKVTWPDKETVTNGTIVVLVAGAVATLYIALVDRLWGYLTNLIY